MSKKIRPVVVKEDILIKYTQQIIDLLRLDPIEFFDGVYDLVEDCVDELERLKNGRRK